VHTWWRLPVIIPPGPQFTFPATERHCPVIGTNLHCLVTEACAYEQLAQGWYLTAEGTKVELSTFQSQG